MILNKEIILLIISIILIIIGLIIVFALRAPKVTTFKLIVSYLGSISVLLVIYNLYVNFQFQRKTEKNRISENTVRNVKNNWLEPQKELLYFYPEGYFLYASMNQDTDLTKDEPKNYDPIKRKQVEVYGSFRVFEAMEDFLSTTFSDLTHVYIWLNNFLAWMQSSILQKHWKLLSFNQSPDARQLIDEIIEKSNQLIELRKKKGHLTRKDYDDISKQIKVKYR